MEKVPYIPDNSVIKQGDHVLRYIKAGQEFPVRTPLMEDATDKSLLVRWDGTAGKAVAMSACVAATPSANELKAVLVSGIYRVSDVNWPDDLSDMQKRAAFQGTAISVNDE